MEQFQQLAQIIWGRLKNELPACLTYHNIDHTRDVMQAVAFLAAAENVNAKDKHLLQTAALFHDTGFLQSRDGHEAISCDIARQYLPGYGYSAAEIETVCSMIMATKLPQSPQNLPEQILCDADLDYLGRDDFFKLSNRLFEELNAECIIKDEDEWNREQIDFMVGHHYFTFTAVNLRQPKKEEYIRLVKSKISTGALNENRQ